jgi:hypothetical protein
MRLLEITLILFVLGAVLQPFIDGLRKVTRTGYYVAIGLLLMALQLLIEGARWQMVPIYAVVTYFTIRWQVKRSQPEQPMKASIGHAILSILLLFIILLPLLVFPMPNLIEPTGPYAVGTRILYFKDEAREEIYASGEGAKRELNVQVWYPGEVGENLDRAPYMMNLELSAPAFAQFLGLPSFVLNHINLIDTHSTLDVPVAREGAPYPVLVFSHGWGGTRTQSTYLMEELASHGYVVVAIDHTYGALVTVFPDGRVVLQKSEILGDHGSGEERDLSNNPLMTVWAGDVGFILDQFERLNSESSGDLFSGKLDFERVGILGHSTGGGNSVQVCWSESRCKAGFVMDAWLMPVQEEVFDQGLSQPFMFMWSEDWGSEENQSRFHDLYTKLRGDGFDLVIEGTRHYDFSDLPLLSPLSPWLGLKGPIDGQRVLRIINDYAVAYFDEYLKGIETPLLEGTSDEYPEVGFDKK